MHIRLAQVDDSAGLAKVQVDSYLIGYRGLVPDSFFEGMTYEEQTREWIDLFLESKLDPLYVAVDDANHILGYALGRFLIKENFDCELRALHVLRDYQRQGYGTALISAIAKHYANAACKSLLLWTLKGNSARAMYEKLGGTLAGEKIYTLDNGTEFAEVAYGWSDINVLILPNDQTI